MDDRPVGLDIYRTAIPMRSFEHSAASRSQAEAVVVHLRLADGREGWGETHPRQYVTGETVETVIEDLAGLLWPEYCRTRGVPFRQTSQGRVINAAACALELAHLDATDGFAREGAAKPTIAARVSGVIGSADPCRTARQLALMRCFGLRDFKLKCGLGAQTDRENLRVVSARLARPLAAARCTLRVDVNGGWDAASTPARVAELKSLGVCVVEQPVFCPAGELADLAARCDLPLMADESLLTDDDANDLLAGPGQVWWNIRISKNGGYLRSLRLARLAAEHGVAFTVGCMVGESAILSAAQRRLLQACPAPRFVEGNYGRFLLRSDVAERSPRFGYGGRLTVLAGGGLGVAVCGRKLARCGRLARSLQAAED